MASAPPDMVRRIVVALNATPHSEAALDAALHLAAQWRVPVQGLFVEDEQLLHAAGLQSVREVHSAVFRPQRFEPVDVQDHWRRVAEYIHDVLRQAARQARVTADLDVVRGRVTRELLQAATDHDVLVVGKTSTDSSRGRIGHTAQRVLAASDASVLILRRLTPATHPVVVYFDGSDDALRAVRMALQAARNTPALPVRILVPPGSPDDIAARRDRLRALCDESDPWFQTRVLRPTEAQHLADTLNHEDARLVVLPASVVPAAPDALQRFLYTVDRPLLVVRTPASSSSPLAPTAPRSRPAMPTPNASDPASGDDAPVTRVVLAPHDASRVTPLELLEDFADASPQWHYLDEASRHYAEAKGVPACVLRHRVPTSGAFVDVAFAASSSTLLSDLTLVLLDAPDAEALDADAQQEIVTALLNALRAYLADRPDHATLRVETA